MKITFCIYNEQRKEVIPLLLNKHSELEISVTNCIYCCGDCSEKPIARINGELFVANNPEELVSNIINYLNK